jgi:hypothetical protein
MINSKGGSMDLLLATSSGLSVCQHDETGWHPVQQGLDGIYVTSVIAREGAILAGTRDGIYRSDDRGTTWQESGEGLSARHIRWLAYHPYISDFEFAGTEPAGIFTSRDGGMSWRECPEVPEMRRRFGWYLPYSPESGCVRGFAMQADRIYAAVEVGGVLVSQDGGESWVLAPGSRGEPHSAPPPFIHPDVHSIAIHSSSADMVFAPTGGGFYRSWDSGTTWTQLYHCYCRAVWVHPDDPEHIILGPADSVDRNGRIEQSLDGGRSWQPASAGLVVPWSSHMVERFIQVGEELMAVLSNGVLLSADLETLSWSQILPDIHGINAATSSTGN